MPTSPQPMTNSRGLRDAMGDTAFNTLFFIREIV
jgi:hypothetical protein